MVSIIYKGRCRCQILSDCRPETVPIDSPEFLDELLKKMPSIFLIFSWKFPIWKSQKKYFRKISKNFKKYQLIFCFFPKNRKFRKFSKFSDLFYLFLKIYFRLDFFLFSMRFFFLNSIKLLLGKGLQIRFHTLFPCNAINIKLGTTGCCSCSGILLLESGFGAPVAEPGFRNNMPFCWKYLVLSILYRRQDIFLFFCGIFI